MAKLDAFTLDKLLSGTPYEGRRLTVCVALSGGRDSVALLHCLKRLENYADGFSGNGESQNDNDKGIKVVAVNVEHGIRGESSLKDSAFVSELCGKLGVELYTFSVDVPAFADENGYTVEQAARILRYRCFDELLDGGKCDLIALAHHLDDQTETVFMRILRGTGIRGLCGMKALNGRYIRPLLEYTREDIDEYVSEHGLDYVEDETNGDTAYTRNYLRSVLTDMKKRFPNMGNSIKRLCDNATEADEFIESFVPQIDVYNGVSYIKTADCANKTVAKRLILRAAAALGVVQDIEDRHLNLALELINGESGKRIDLTHGLRIYKEGDRLVFTVAEKNAGKKENAKNEVKAENAGMAECEGHATSADMIHASGVPFEVGVFDYLGISVKEVDKTVAKSMLGKGGALYADADKIPASAVIRNCREGDFIRKFGGGTKSVGDYLTDKKIPARVRGDIKVIADGNRVLAVFGVDISADLKIGEATERVYELRLVGKDKLEY